MFKKIIVGAALTLSSLAFAGPHHGAVPVAPVPAPAANMNNDRFDVMQGRMLLRELDARRSFRSHDIDARISAFITSEMNESRRDSRQLSRLLSDFSRVQGRFDYRATAEKRRVLTEAISIAERDLRGNGNGNGNHFGRR
ncbi:MAG: hypothetical protein QM817_32095 [Archangium sp.]